MYRVLVLALLTITLTSGFTCSKNESVSQTPTSEASGVEAHGSMTMENIDEAGAEQATLETSTEAPQSENTATE